jgi:hypothetical protein
MKDRGMESRIGGGERVEFSSYLAMPAVRDNVTISPKIRDDQRHT